MFAFPRTSVASRDLNVHQNLERAPLQTSRCNPRAKTTAAVRIPHASFASPRSITLDEGMILVAGTLVRSAEQCDKQNNYVTK